MENFHDHYWQQWHLIATVQTVYLALRLQFVVDQDRHYPVSIIIILVIPILSIIKCIFNQLQYNKDQYAGIFVEVLNITLKIFISVNLVSIKSNLFIPGNMHHKRLIDRQHSILPSINGDVPSYWEKVFFNRTANEFLCYSKSLLILVSRWKMTA